MGQPWMKQITLRVRHGRAVMICTVAALGVIDKMDSSRPDAASLHLRPRLLGCLSYGRVLWSIATYFQCVREEARIIGACGCWV